MELGGEEQDALALAQSRARVTTVVRPDYLRPFIGTRRCRGAVAAQRSWVDSIYQIGIPGVLGAETYQTQYQITESRHARRE